VPQIDGASFDVVVGVFMAFVATMHANFIGRDEIGFKVTEPLFGFSVPRVDVQPTGCHYVAFGNSGTRLPSARSRATVQIARR